MAIVTIWRTRLREHLLEEHAEVVDLVLVDRHDEHAVGRRSRRAMRSRRSMNASHLCGR